MPFEMPKENPSADGVLNIIDPQFTAHPQPIYQQVLRDFRVAKTIGMQTPILSRYEDVVWALRHPEIFSSEIDMKILIGNERPLIPQQVDPPQQVRYRKILDPQFSRPKMEQLDAAIRLHAQALIDAVVDAGQCEFDAAFAVPLPCRAFLSLMGLPQEDLSLFLELKDGIIRPPVPPMDLIAAGEYRIATGKRIYAYFEQIIAERRRAPEDDMVTYLTQVDLDGRKLTPNEVLDICYLLLLGGLDTVTSTLGCSIAFLAANPAHRRRVATGGPEVVSKAIEELLRFETPVTMVPRVLRQDVTIGDTALRAGDLVNLLIGAANLDEAEFPESMRVDFERERNRHIAFGAGPHRCLGSHLARMELRAALEEWHRRIPDYAIAPGETPRVSYGIREFLYLPLVWETGAARAVS